MSLEKRARIAKDAFLALVFLDMCEDEELSQEREKARRIAAGRRSGTEIALSNSMTRCTVESMTDTEFRKTFRFRRVTYEAIRARIGAHEASHETRGRRPTASLDARLLMTLEYIATGCRLATLNRVYKHPQSSMARWIDGMIETISTVFAYSIAFPSAAELPSLARTFSKRAGLTQCVGAMDGCVVKCTLWGSGGPQGLDTYYCSRKACYGILLHAIVDGHMRFRFVQYGYGASNGDSRVLQSSGLWKAQSSSDPWVPPPYYLVADSAYPMQQWLVRPLTEREAQSNKDYTYNNYVSRTRIVVEQAFGKLKKQWTAIAEPHSNVGPAKVSSLLGAALVLHNLTILFDADYVFTERELSEFVEAADTAAVPNTTEDPRDDTLDCWRQVANVADEAWSLHVAAHPEAAGTADQSAVEKVTADMARRGAARVTRQLRH